VILKEAKGTNEFLERDSRKKIKNKNKNNNNNNNAAKEIRGRKKGKSVIEKTWICYLN